MSALTGLARSLAAPRGYVQYVSGHLSPSHNMSAPCITWTTKRSLVNWFTSSIARDRAPRAANLVSLQVDTHETRGYGMLSLPLSLPSKIQYGHISCASLNCVSLLSSNIPFMLPGLNDPLYSPDNFIRLSRWRALVYNEGSILWRKRMNVLNLSRTKSAPRIEYSRRK